MKLIGGNTLLWYGGLSTGGRRPPAPPPPPPPVDAPPVVGADSATTVAGETIRIDVLANDADPEGGALALTGASAENGAVTVVSGGMLSYTAPADFSGTDTITYTVADPAGNISQGSVSVEVEAPAPIDLPPTAGDVSATAVAGGTVLIPVLETATDPEGGPLTITAASAGTGTVTIVSDGTLSYTAPADFSGTDTITYTVADPAGNISQGSVSVEVEAPAPIDLPPTAGDVSATAVAGGTVLIPVLETATDPEGGPLTITAASAGTGTVTIVSDGTLSYTAPADFSGADAITYTVADPAGNSVQGSVSVEVILLSLIEGTEPGEFVVTSAPGELTVSIIAPAEHAGDYVLYTTDLEAGPVNLVPPRIAGTAAAGESLTAIPGLWAFDEADEPFVRTLEWVRGTTPISGQTGTTYTIDGSADAGQTIRVFETGATMAGERTTPSAGLDVPEAPARDTAWTPASLPALTAWFDAADASTVTTSAGQVTQWTDKSGNGYHATPQNVGPALTTLNGVQAINFTSGNPLQFSQPIGGRAARTLFAAVGEVGGNKRCLVTLGASSILSYSMSGYNSSVLQLALRNGVDLSTSRPLAAAGVVGFIHDGGETASGTSVSVDGTVTTPFSASAEVIDSGAGASLIGRRSFSSSTNTGGPIGEIVLCATALSDTDRQKLEGYLAHKWGFTDLLPATHPYKSAPPTA